MHVVTIKSSSSNREYTTIQRRLFDNNNDEIVICIDIDSRVNFIDKTLLSSKNLYNRIRNCKLITVRDIVDERIVDRQIDLSIYVRAINKAIKLFNIYIYINKSIEINIILGINKLDYKKNNIALQLGRKYMQLSNCNIFINFNSLEKMSINFYYEKIVKFKKRVRFAIAISYFAFV